MYFQLFDAQAERLQMMEVDAEVFYYHSGHLHQFSYATTTTPAASKTVVYKEGIRVYKETCKRE